MLKLLTLSIAFFISAFSLVSADEDKTAPTYFTTFNDHTQLSWKSYREKGTSLSQWGFNSKASNQMDKYATHDYPVGGSDQDTCRDWFVSPYFSYYEGAKLSFDYNLFVMMGSRTPADRFEVYISKGSRDPADGDFQLLLDLSDSTVGEEFHSISIDLPFDTDEERDSCYIAFLYQATWNWYIPGIDNLAAAVEEPSSIEDEEIETTDVLYLNGTAFIRTYFQDSYECKIFNTCGSEEFAYKGSSNLIELNMLRSGFYIYRIITESGKVYQGKILIW